MKKLFCKIVLVIVLLCTVVVRIYGINPDEGLQNPRAGLDCLGIWTYLQISESNRQSDGTYLVTMPVPPEGISDRYYPRGPGGPRFTNFLGNTVDVVFRSDVLEEIREYSVSGAEPVFEMPVNKWVDGFLYNTNGVGMVCYYYVVLHVN